MGTQVRIENYPARTRGPLRAPPGGRRRRRAGVLLAALSVLAITFAVLAALSPGGSRRAGAATASGRRAPGEAALNTRHGALAAAAPALSVRAPRNGAVGWSVIARVGGLPVAWLERRGGVTLMRFDQAHVRLHTHAGSLDGGVSGWTFGNHIGASEEHALIASFNGGFKLSYRDTGFMANGKVAKPLRAGLASVVTYANGITNIGAWRQGVPSVRSPVFSVLQNQRLLIDHGRPAGNLATCVTTCWGGTIGLATVVARSGLGITASGELVWAGGEQMSPTQLASALISAGAVRAIELDINPWWVAGYVYPHRGIGAPAAVGVVRGQRGIQFALLRPYSRDFFTVVGN